MWEQLLGQEQTEYLGASELSVVFLFYSLSRLQAIVGDEGEGAAPGSATVSL